MYWTVTILSLAVLWLAHRLYVLAKIPVDHLIKTLKIEIPKSSKISVDNITNDKLFIHWDLPASEPKVTAFAIYLNGQQIQVLNGSESQCYLTNLLPDTRYKIDLISINSKNYKAKSDSIYIITKSDKIQNYANNILLENPENLFKLLTDNPDVTTIQKFATPSTSTSNPEGKAPGRSRSATASSVTGNNLSANANGGSGIASYAASTTSLMPDPRSLDDIEELRYYLVSGQEELHTILNQQAQALNDFKEQESVLIDERDKLRERKKLEDGNRQSMKSEIKMLDDSRRLTELKKSKQENAWVTKQKAIEKMEADLANWNIQIDDFEKQKTDLSNSEESIHREIGNDISKKKERIKELQEQIAKIDEDVKSMNSEKKQKEQLKPQFAKIFKSLMDHTDQSGCLDAEGVKSLELLKSIDTAIHGKVLKEIENDTRLEAEWRAQQQREVTNCARASSAKERLIKENKELKSLVNPSRSHSATPPSNNSQPQPLHQQPAVLQQHHQQLQAAHQQQQQQQQQQNQSSVSPPPNTFQFGQNGFHYGDLQSGSSPSLNSFMTQQQQQQKGSTPPAFNSSSLWNTLSVTGNNFPNAPSSDSGGFSFNTTLPTSGASGNLLNGQNDVLSGSMENQASETDANHLLPRNLIDEDADFIKLLNSVQSASPVENHTTAHTVPFGLGNAFNNTVNESSANISTRSLFHNDFNQPRFSLDNASSPPHSFNNADLISTQMSPPSTANNDIHSVFSGNNGDLLQHNSFQPTSSLELDAQTPKENNHLSTFSPRRLSNVFSFGKKNHEHEPESVQNHQISSKSSQHSKFFGNKLNGKSDTSETSDGNSKTPLFSFTQDISNGSARGHSNESSKNSNSIIDAVWQSPALHNKNQSHNRNVSVHSSHSNNTSFERDHGTSKFFPTSGEGNDFLNPNSAGNVGSNMSISSGAISDGTAGEQGESMGLVNTNKTSNTASIKSIKSSSADNASNVSSSPSFFRKNKFLVNPFGGNNNNNQQNDVLGGKSPSRQNSTLFRTTSPTKNNEGNFTNDDSDIEDYNPETPTGTTPKRLFSRNRKTSSSNIRKQSVNSVGANSSHDVESNNLTDGSIQSAHSNSNSNKTLNFKKLFGGKNSKENNAKDNIDDIDEKVEDE